MNGELRMKGDDIADRLLNFGKRVLRLCRAFPDDFAGKHVANLLIVRLRYNCVG